MRAATLTLTVILGLSGAGAASEPEGAAAPYGTPSTPKAASDVASTYHRGDGLGYNITLTLRGNGTYAASWRGCLGVYGKSHGRWTLSGSRVVFSPARETDMMKGHSTSLALETQTFEGKWILVPTAGEDAAFFRKYGVSRTSCFLQGRD